jgi:hypothetical protein
MAGAAVVGLACASPAGPGETDGGEPFEVEASVVTYERQPMVVDVQVVLSAPGSATVTHETDPGVVVERIDDSDPSEPWDTATFRLRGVAPDAEHPLRVEATSTGGKSASETLSFSAESALPGFIPQFDVTVSGDPEPVYRLADLSTFGIDDQVQGAVLIDPEGRSRWYWSEIPEFAGGSGIWGGVQLLDDGSLLYLNYDRLHAVDELGSTVFEITTESLGVPTFHHDVIVLPNGNLVAIGMEFSEHDYPGEGVLPIVGDTLMEIDPDGTLVWEWSALDHLDPGRRTEGFFDSPPILDPADDSEHFDWSHANGVIYLPEEDLLVVSMRHQDWMVAVDHATGEVAWRLGLDGDFALTEGTWFFHQHSPEMQPDGTMLLYDNAVGNPAMPPVIHSRAVRYALDFDAMTARQVWQDDHAPFLSGVMGDADRMPGGHVLVLDSALDWNVTVSIHARLRELDPTASPMEVWRLETPNLRFMYRAVPSTRMVGEAR